eukprot:scaffold2696_cov104-Cylindrotheca_fusiformis.AAC.7
MAPMETQSSHITVFSFHRAPLSFTVQSTMSNVVAQQRQNASSIVISETTKSQLRSCLAILASTHQNNPFHNLEHASNVTASVEKLLT